MHRLGLGDRERTNQLGTFLHVLKKRDVVGQVLARSRAATKSPDDLRRYPAHECHDPEHRSRFAAWTAGAKERVLETHRR